MASDRRLIKGNSERDVSRAGANLKDDADKTYNRAGDTSFPGLKARLKTVLDLLRDCAGTSCWMETFP